MSNKRKVVLGTVLLAALAAAVLILWNIFSVKKITVSGNDYYTEEEIEKLVLKNQYYYNSLYLWWKYKYDNDYTIPFIDMVEVELVSVNEVKINVYEKSMVGYIEYLGSYMYFDKDGVVVESSSALIEGIPLITGLKFDHIMLYKELAVSDRAVFNTIVSITQLLSKYEIAPDKIYFNRAYEMTLYFGGARVYLGTDKETEEKIIRLKNILPSLEGLSGVLHMENYTEGVSDITFEKDK